MRFLLLFCLALPVYGYDFSLAIEGPQTAWRGQPIRLSVKSALLEGPRAMVDYSVQAPGVASFPMLVKTCCGANRGWQPANTDMVIAVAPDAPLGAQRLTLTATSGGETRTASFQIDVREMPPANGFVSVFGQSAADVQTWAAQMEEGRKACELNVSMWEGLAWYYDGQRVFRQIADYTGNATWLPCAEQSEGVYRTWLLSLDGKIQGWRVFPHGLYRDFIETGDEESKRAVLLMAGNSAFAFRDGGVGVPLSRETAYLLNARRLANKLGADHDIGLMAATSLGHLNQWVRDRPYTQPFMVGLTIEALIGYHEDTGDGRVLPMVQAAIDLLWSEYWDPAKRAFRYDDNATSGAPDLNMLIAPAFAWVYRMTGDAKYLERGDEIFNGGVAGAWLGGGKQFSQQYRWSFDYVEWVTPDAVPEPAPEPAVTRSELSAIIKELRESSISKAELRALIQQILAGL